jgi:hypothetical protein
MKLTGVSFLLLVVSWSKFCMGVERMRQQARNSFYNHVTYIPKNRDFFSSCSFFNRLFFDRALHSAIKFFATEQPKFAPAYVHVRSGCARGRARSEFRMQPIFPPQSFGAERLNLQPMILILHQLQALKLQLGMAVLALAYLEKPHKQEKEQSAISKYNPKLIICLIVPYKS